MTEPLTRLMDSKQCKDSEKRKGKRPKKKKNKRRGGGTKEGKDKDDFVNGGGKGSTIPLLVSSIS